MTQIGSFTLNHDSYSGSIRTLVFSAELCITTVEAKGPDRAPDYRIFMGEGVVKIEIGAGWKHAGTAGDYVAIQIDDPGFEHPIRANLFQKNDASSEYLLMWNRPSWRKARA